MKDEDVKPKLMKLLGISDEKIADKVLHYAKLVNDPTSSLVNPKPKEQAKKLLDTLRATDFANAKELNERIISIIDLVSEAVRAGKKADTNAINTSYILIANELQKIYKRNDELANIKPEPIWKDIEIIEGSEYEVQEYVWQSQGDAGQQHNAKVNKLCIIVNATKPSFTKELNDIVAKADKNISDYEELTKQQNNSTNTAEKNWYIPEYRLTYKPDGTILVNGVKKVKKTQAGSASDKLIEQAIANPNTLFKPNLGNYSRNISTTLSGIGFSGTLRALFFPTVSEDKGIVFRPTISRKTADSERIDTSKLDDELYQLDADVTQKEISLDDIPF